MALAVTTSAGPVEMVLDLDDAGATLRLPEAVRPGGPVAAELISASRHLLDLDADPGPIAEALGADPDLRELLAIDPGLRVPGAVSGYEVAVRTIVGQQISVAGAATVVGRLVRTWGEPVPGATRVSHAFPAPEVVAAVDPEALPMPRARGRAVVGLARAVAEDRVDLTPGVEPAALRAQLLALAGVGPWTADYVAMRVVRDPDVLLATDLILRRELVARGIDAARTESWRPWRSSAGMLLWRSALRRSTP